jgi:hypothetical protein
MKLLITAPSARIACVVSSQMLLPNIQSSAYAHSEVGPSLPELQPLHAFEYDLQWRNQPDCASFKSDNASFTLVGDDLMNMCDRSGFVGSICSRNVAKLCSSSVLSAASNAMHVWVKDGWDRGAREEQTCLLQPQMHK